MVLLVTVSVPFRGNWNESLEIAIAQDQNRAFPSPYRDNWNESLALLKEMYPSLISEFPSPLGVIGMKAAKVLAKLTSLSFPSPLGVIGMKAVELQFYNSTLMLCFRPR